MKWPTHPRSKGRWGSECLFKGKSFSRGDLRGLQDGESEDL